jgi:hypothetical protein
MAAGGVLPYPGTMPFDLGGGRQKKKGAAKPKSGRTKSLPAELDGDSPSSNLAYQEALTDASLVFSPQALGFLPSNYWLATDATFGDLVTKFFQRKNNANCRFPHKLYNALSLVDHEASLFGLLGVHWITDRIFKVDKFIFGRLLGITSIDGGLFHRQGNFPSHGFAELTGLEVQQVRVAGAANVADVDQDRVRLLYHKGSMFAKASTEDSVTRCKWITESEPRL